LNSTHRTTASTLILAAILTASLWIPVSAQFARTCEVPLYIKQSSTDANVLILFDTSGSMNEIVHLPGYDPAVSYSGNFSSTRTYYASTDGWFEPQDFSWTFPTTPSAYLVESDGGKSGQYPGNYMNWLYFHATAAQRALSIGHLTRIQTAKVAMSDVVSNVDNVRFGIWEFNGGSGGREVTSPTTNKATLLADINGRVGDSWTPLAEALEDMHDALVGDPTLIEAYCQKTFIIIMTDGFPTQDVNVHSRFRDYDKDGNDPGDCTSIGAPYSNSYDCSDHLDDVAAYMYNEDLRTDMDGDTPAGDKQNATIYTIGFGIDAGILKETALNGGGNYANANDLLELRQALASTLLDIITKKSSGTSATVVSSENATDNRLFRARFAPGTWEGQLEAFALPYTDGDSPVWKAGTKLKNRDPDTRKLWTSTTGTNKVKFELSNLALLQPVMNVSAVDTATAIVSWVRGENVSPWRDRKGWKLGDIVDSSPVTVGAPANFHDFLDYNQFKIDNKDRIELIYVGANDGMIHAFRQDNGREYWAYLPKNNLDRLYNQMDVFYCHEFYNNLTPAAFDVHIGGAWKTVLVVGQREGGNAYTALDVTDPRSGQFKVMWDLEFPQVVESWATPVAFRDETLDQYVLAFGTGLDPSGDASMLIVDVETGAVLHTEYLSAAASGPNLVSEAVAFDKDFDGYDDLAYATDMSGAVWRFDMSTFPWGKSKLFDTGGKPISARPTLSMDHLGRVLVYFGTGKYVEDTDIKNVDPQTIYAVIDDHSGSLRTPSDLKDQTSSVGPLGSSMGWYIDLNNSGERVTQASALAGGTLYMVSFLPNAALCKAGGKSWLWEVDYEDGSNPDENDGTEDDGDDERRNNLGDGIYSEPTVDLANEDIIVQSTKTKITTRDAKGEILRIIVRSWRQQYN